MSTLSVDAPVLTPADEVRATPATLPDAAVTSTIARNPTLDAARALAAIALVWIHTTQSSFSRFHLLGRFGTSFFVLASIFFLFHKLGSSPTLTFGAYVRKRFHRLYIPFLSWTLIYLLIRDIKRLATHQPLLDMQFGRLLAGVSMQFWFLPFIFLAGIICFPLPALLQRIDKARLLLLPLIIAIGVFISLTPRPPTPGLDEVTNYFLNSAWVFAPSIFWAVALAILYPLLPPRTRQSPLLALLGIVLTASCIFYLWTIRNSVNPLPSLPRTLAGVGWLLVALVPYRGRLVTLLAPIGRYSYGIFLVHPIFVASLQALARSLHISPAGWLDLLVVALAFPASALLTAFLASQRWTRWLVP